MGPHGQLRSSYDYGTNGTTSSYEKKFFRYHLGPITATNTGPHCGALCPAPATNYQQVQVRLVPSELRTGNKSKSRWSQLSYGNGNNCAAIWSIRQPKGDPPLMKRLPLLHRLKRRNWRCLPLKPLHLHQHRLRRRRLRQPARPLVKSEDVGVAVLVEAVESAASRGSYPKSGEYYDAHGRLGCRTGVRLAGSSPLGWAQAYRTANFSAGGKSLRLAVR